MQARKVIIIAGPNGAGKTTFALEREAMNPRPIETAQDEDLRLSRQAMQRAAARAWEIAARTGTAIIIRRAGVIEAVRPAELDPLQRQQAPHAPDAGKP
ncbi:MAG: hypothetical protein PHF02_04185 [Tepidiphilus sp.]|nr:hypothetical protein [Tepidiphilus sp.]